LRIEDTDLERSSLDSVRAILDALRWLGLGWDEGPELGGDYGPYFQSDRKVLYKAAAEQLIRDGKAYRCFCTKEELDAQRAALKAKDPKAQFVYPRTCRERTDHPDKPFVVRFKSPDSGSTDFPDLVFGLVSTPNSQQQDFVLLRQNGLPLYNLGCVVDDHEMKIDLVARGRDHIGNTPQQVLLYQAFGWDMPRFAHLPMMLSQKGEKLSKRHAAVSVAEYRERGYTAEGVLNYLVRFGWSYGDQEIFSRQQLIDSFSWDRVGKSDGKFDEQKFADVAFEHLKRPELTDDASYVLGTLPFLRERGLEADPAVVARALPVIRERARSFADAANHLDFYFREPPELDPKAAKSLTPDAAPKLDAMRVWLAAQTGLDAPELEAAFKAWVEQQGWALKQVAQAARAALTGRTASPGLFDVIQILGKEISIARLARGAELARAAESAS
jgi:glutamyl-tRNA synthetase